MMKFSTSQDPLNYIYTSYNTLNAIVESSVANAVVETDDNGNESTTAFVITSYSIHYTKLYDVVFGIRAKAYNYFLQHEENG